MVRWALLLLFVVASLFYLNSAAYCAWVSGGPPTDYPEFWLQRSVVHFGFSVASGATGVVLFLVLGAAKRRRRIIYLSVGLAVIAVALLWPHLREFLNQDKCLDSGGAWDEKSFVCLHEWPDGRPPS